MYCRRPESRPVKAGAFQLHHRAVRPGRGATLIGRSRDSTQFDDLPTFSVQFFSLSFPSSLQSSPSPFFFLSLPPLIHSAIESSSVFPFSIFCIT